MPTGITKSMDASKLEPQGITSYRRYFLDMFETKAEKLLDEVKEQMLVSKAEMMEPVLDKKSEMSGEERFAEYERLLEEGLCLWKLHNFQRAFLEKIKMATCPLIYGAEWDDARERVCAQRNWKIQNMSRFVLGSAPRRFGKSVVVAKHLIAFALVMPNSIQAGFSTGRRASSNTLALAARTLVAQGLSDWIVKFNQEELWIADPNDRFRPRKIFFYPSNAKVTNYRKKIRACFFSVLLCCM
jgi:hypothetical protein